MNATQLVTIKEASQWATDYLERSVSDSNISYLIQYGKIKKFNGDGTVKVMIGDLMSYYKSFNGHRELTWKKKLGDDLNWALSFDNLREVDTTKHVHRLHPYKGKFIPQLVQYFIDDHIDQFKTETFFERGDVILDPFAGSGTTLVQANELGIHAIGIDISQFNCMISEAKLLDYDIVKLEKEIKNIMIKVNDFEIDNNLKSFEADLYSKMADFNNKYFPSPEFKSKVNRKEIDEWKFALVKENDFLKIYNELIKKYKIKLEQDKNSNFLDKWYVESVRKEIDYTFGIIRDIKDIKIKKILAVILSRTIRSCRATTHSDLATLKKPQITTYYCFKHKKICKPIFSIKDMLARYATDTVQRLKTFSQLKGHAYYAVLPADSRTADINKEVKKRSQKFYDILSLKKIKGIFSSPPYVGQIDYHEQHAYAYDLMGFERNDEMEIGPLFKGQGIEARRSYAEGISNVLLNCRKFLTDDFDVFLVANDKYNLYPDIAVRSGMQIVNQYKRPVLNRTERDKSPYSEIIFHLKNL